jgi:hypothetical protein
MKKYFDNRHHIQQGDIILFRGNAVISRAIRWLDNAPYNHAAVVFESHGRKLILESTQHGVNPRFLSAAILKEKYTDFCLIRPKRWEAHQIEHALTSALICAERTIEYDFKLMAEIAIKRLTNKNVKWGSKRLDICSEFARRYARHFRNPIADNFEMPRMPNAFITPWDFVIYAEPHFEVILNEFEVQNSGLRVRDLASI